ncbi:MAG: hypothetical protein HYV09_38665 [Deltaproteobacteria bacterium]|nr:hypothetical protein [Deltaproteobacteria bacterium]
MVPRFVLLLFVALSASACHRIGSCEAMDANGLKTGCSGPEGWVWDGSSCIFTQACNCTGADCQGLYHDREHCETAHTHCVK